ncbi:MAG: ComEC/Rec2 family competence protein [Clostridium sp.]
MIWSSAHPDNDHLQGLKQVGEHFTVNQVIVPDLPQDLLPSADEYLSTVGISGKDVPIKQAVPNETVWLDELKIEFLAPLQFYDTMNNNSVVVKLTYGDTSFLMMGDAEKEEEQDLLNSGANLQADVIKIGHHGSKTSTNEDF